MLLAICPLTKARSNDTPVAMTVSSFQILISNNNPQIIGSMGKWLAVASILPFITYLLLSYIGLPPCLVYYVTAFPPPPPGVRDLTQASVHATRVLLHCVPAISVHVWATWRRE
jgi:hypothetical protein